MEFGTREILIILGIIIILGILLDGLRRIKSARYGSLKVSRRKQAIFDDDGLDDLGGEFPTGQVRVKHRDERSVEEVSDNIKRYRESTTNKCTTAYRDIAGEQRKPAKDHHVEEHPSESNLNEKEKGSDTPADEEPLAFGKQSAVEESPLDQFAVDDDGRNADEPAPYQGDEESLVPEPEEQPWVASRNEPDLELNQPFHVGDSEPGKEQPGESSPRKENRGKPFWENEKPAATSVESTSRQQPREEAGESASASREFDVVVVHVMAKPEQFFDGAALLDALLSNGLRYGEMGIFHRHEKRNGSGPVKFSLANSINPGTFDIENMESFSTPGVTLFMPLEKLQNPLEYFDEFVKTAQSLAKSLGGELKDETRSVLTKQTIEHYRQQIIEYTRRSFTLSHN